MITIPLSRGLHATIDEVDAEHVLARRWRADIDKSGRPFAISCDFVKSRAVAHYRLDRFILGVDATKNIRHLDGNRLNCTRANLVVEENLSARQQRKNWAVGASGYRGVTLDRRVQKWRANISINDRCHWLGQYDTPEEAARRYDEAALQLHGSGSRLNFG